MNHIGGKSLYSLVLAVQPSLQLGDTTLKQELDTVAQL